MREFALALPDGTVYNLVMSTLGVVGASGETKQVLG